MTIANITYVNMHTNLRHWLTEDAWGRTMVETTLTPMVRMIHYKDVWIGPLMQVKHADGTIDRLNMAPHRPTEWPNEQIAKFDEPAIFIGGDKLFGHCVFEHATRIRPLFDCGFDERWIVGDRDTPVAASDMFQVLAGDIPIASVTLPCHFNDVVVLDAPIGRTPNGGVFFWPDAFYELRKAMRPHMHGQRITRRLFLRRDGAKHRILKNQDAIIEALKPHGFDAIDLSQLPFLSQVGAVSQADLIVSPIGSGSPITIWTHADIIELSPPGIDGIFGSRLAAFYFGNRFTKIVGVADGPGRDDNYEIDPERVIDAVLARRMPE